MQRIPAGAVLLLLSASAVSAADVYRLPYEPQPELRSSHDWTGGYVGLHGGYGWGEASGTTGAGVGGGGLLGGAGGLLGGILGGDGLLGGLLGGIGGGGGGGDGLGGLFGDLLCGLFGSCGGGGGGGGGLLAGIPGLDSLDELLGGIFDPVTGLTGDDLDLRGSGDGDMEGFLGGAQIGYNWQSGGMVLGMEADLSITGMSSDASFEATGDLAGLSLDLGGADPLDIAAGEVAIAGAIETDLNWLGTIRGRFGYAVDRVLVFGTGGVAFGDVDVDAFVSTNVNIATGAIDGVAVDPLSLSSTVTGAGSEMMVGYTLGAGVEYAFSERLTGKLEYAYVNLGETRVRMSDGSSMDVEIDMHLVKAGANIRF